MIDPATIAKICHDANRAYCEELGDRSQQIWDNAPTWQKQSAINGVTFVLGSPDVSGEDLHNEWVDYKKRTGWARGPKKDPDKKEHPMLVPYKEVPEDQKQKYRIFISIVKSFVRPESKPKFVPTSDPETPVKKPERRWIKKV